MFSYKVHLPIIIYGMLLSLILGAILRFYRARELAVFLADQASDSQKVLDMVHGKLTLLGPITSVGGFYNGPIVYYLMYPFYLLFKGDPLAGTVFQTVLSLATIPLVYLIGKKIKNETVGRMAAFLFAISPLMIDYSRAAFNSYPAIFFSTLIIYLFILLIERYRWWLAVFIGIMIGWIVQMHYFAGVFLILTLFYPLFIKKNRLPISYYFLLLTGFVAGISPFLLFEVRHQFLNTQLFFKYLVSSKAGNPWSINNTLYIWPQVTGWLTFGNQFALGALGFVAIAASTVSAFLKKQVKHISIFIWLFFLVLFTGLIYGRTMHDHYIISFHASIIILLALAIVSVFKGKSLPILICCLILFAVNFPAWNLLAAKHPLQRGLNMTDFKKAAEIIKKDEKGVYNVAMHAQGDNRAMPLRYFLTLTDEKPLDYEHYGEADTLYFIIPNSESLQKQTMWEYISFGSSRVLNKWQLNKDYVIYKLGE